MKYLQLSFIAFICCFLFSLSAQAQCETWVNSPKQDQAEEAHVLYRQFLKSEQFDQAFEQWQKVFAVAPAADGQRSFHYSDGRDIYMHKMKNETDEAKKAEYKTKILELYDQQMECYPKEKVFLLGRKAYDMYYHLNSMYSDNLAAINAAIEEGGNNVEYIIMDPAARIAVYQFKNKLLSQEEARDLNIKLNEIADHNIENNAEFGEGFQTAKDAMNGVFAEIEDEIFDCDYFKGKLLPKFKENPEDLEILKYVYNKLTTQGCDPEDPDLKEVKSAYEVKAAAINAELEAQKRIDNPGYDAKLLYDEGNFDQAMVRYKDAIAQEADPTKKGEYYFSLASIQFRKMKQYNAARESARKAADLKGNWGRPYMLIGDMYASTSSSCGKEAWDKQIAVLAAIDKYSYAKSIDPGVAEEANEKIGRYSGFKPTKEEGFMRKVSEGQSVKVKCWIGETVRMRFQ